MRSESFPNECFCILLDSSKFFLKTFITAPTSWTTFTYDIPTSVASAWKQERCCCIVSKWVPFDAIGATYVSTVFVILYWYMDLICSWTFKGAPSGPRQFLGTESPLKIMSNAFYFTLKALFVLKLFKFLSWQFY